ncbi:MAG: DCC1-like thiol-disulfide oxidoreductase family protein [Gammaproteobacteria bacterium]|nr:DCC1-like thiol-disulfide oxidoreductase family protein [Gammaproteobacteria bacterium]
MTAEPTAELPVVIFDGVCNLCNGAVQFIIQRDPKQRFVFSPAQSPYAQALLAEHGLQDLGLESFVLVENQQAYLRTTAALRIAHQLSGLWFFFGVFRIVPAPIRDWFYNALGKRRYQCFGKRQQCMVPTPELQARFRTAISEQ